MMQTNDSTPPPGALLHLLYLAENGQLSERLIRLERADTTLFKGRDLIKEEFRSFRRERIYWTKNISDKNEYDDVFFRLWVRSCHNAP